MLDELGIAHEQLRQLKKLLSAHVIRAEKEGMSKAENERMVDFLLDNIYAVRQKIIRLESRKN